MIGNVGAALKRKFGPLPAWAWAGIALVAVLFYRRFKGQQSGSATSPISPVGELQGGDQQKQDPVVLQPGESVYDPNTGQLVGGGNGDPSGPPTTEPPGPGPDEPPGTPGTRKKTPQKRRAKIKIHIKRPIAHPHHPKGRTAKPRGGSSLRDSIRKKASKPAVRRAAHPATQKPAKPRAQKHTATKPERGHAKMPPQAALRSHPAAKRAIDHTAQKAVTAHPAAHPAAHPPPPPPPPHHAQAAPKKRK